MTLIAGLCLCLYFWVGPVTSILTFPAETTPDRENRCHTEIYLSETHSFNGKISIEGDPKCKSVHIAVVTDDDIYDRILYYFDDLDSTGCTSGLTEDIQEEGNETVCREHEVFETTENELNVTLLSDELSDKLTAINKSSIELVFTAFHKGRCESYDFQCDDGRCIYHALSCSGDNPCGDNSDCKISIPAIAAICLGGVCILGVCAVILFIACKACPCCCCCRCGRGHVWEPRRYSATKALENNQSFTPATVTFVPLHRSWSHK